MAGGEVVDGSGSGSGAAVLAERLRLASAKRWCPRSLETEYLKACEYYKVNRDPSVLIAIKTGSTAVKTRLKYNETSVLPLIDVLSKVEVYHQGANTIAAGLPETEARRRRVVLEGNAYADGDEDLRAPFIPFYFDERPPSVSISPSISPKSYPFYITYLQLSNGKLGSDGALVLGKFLELNPHLLSLDISHNGIGALGACGIARGLLSNTTLVTLDIRSNSIRYEGGHAFVKVVINTTSLKFINLSNCNIGFHGVSELNKALKQRNTTIGVETAESKKHTEAFVEMIKQREELEAETPSITPSASSENLQHLLMSFEASSASTSEGRKRPREGINVKLTGNLVLEEVFNGSTHGFGILLAFIGAILMMRSVWNSTGYHKIAGAVFSFSLVLLYTCSCLFHLFFKLGTIKVIFQVMDHLAIFVLIAGTYTPFLLIALHGPDSIAMLIVMWSIAIVGVVQDIYFKISAISLTLHLIMGWMGTLIANQVTMAISPIGLYWLIAGGAMYTLGVPFYVMGEKVRNIYHTVWHCFVLAASICHYVSVYFYVMPLSLPPNDAPFTKLW